MKQSLRLGLVTISALFAALIGAVVPEGRWMIVYSGVAALILVPLLRARSSKFIFLSSYVALLALGYLLSHYFYENNSLTSVGMLLLWAAMIGAAVVVFKIFGAESRLDDSAGG